MSLADVQGGLEDVEGATERAGARMNESFSTRAISLARQFMDSLLPLGETLLDIGEDILPEVQEKVEDFTEVMEVMDSETAQTIVKFAGLAVAAGPVIKTISGGISVYTKLSSSARRGIKSFGSVRDCAGIRCRCGGNSNYGGGICRAHGILGRAFGDLCANRGWSHSCGNWIICNA